MPKRQSVDASEYIAWLRDPARRRYNKIMVVPASPLTTDIVGIGAPFAGRADAVIDSVGALIEPGFLDAIAASG